MDTVDMTIRYLFLLGLVLIVVAYYAGSQQILKTIFSGVNTLDDTATGRTANGTFAAYPK